MEFILPDTVVILNSDHMRRKKSYQVSIVKLLFLLPFYIMYGMLKLIWDILTEISIPKSKPKPIKAQQKQQPQKTVVHYVKQQNKIESWQAEKIRSEIRKSENSIEHLEKQLDYLIKEYYSSKSDRKRFQLDKQIVTIENRLETENSKIRQYKMKMKGI